jgi:outer membrane biosynthesis protein TonB
MVKDSEKKKEKREREEKKRREKKRKREEEKKRRREEKKRRREEKKRREENVGLCVHFLALWIGSLDISLMIHIELCLSNQITTTTKEGNKSPADDNNPFCCFENE